MAGNGRFYAEVSVTIYANTQEEAEAAAEQVAAAIRSNTDRDDVGSVIVEDVDSDALNQEGR